MNVLYLNDIDNSRVKKQFDKTVRFFENDDFDSAEIKKLTNGGYYRAKLDYENRLLFKFAKYNNQTYVLLLEVIYNHAYEKSRFLRGAKIDEDKLKAIKSEKQVAEEEMVGLSYINHSTNKFHLLNKVLSFDDLQQNIFNIKPPVIIVGSAGSGKTVLTLEKIKQLSGNVLYITLSAFLVDNSSRLYFSDYYVNEKQEVDFLSFKEYMETLKVIPGKEIDFKNFNAWLLPRKHSFGISDAYKLFEEFKGVITGIEITKPFLSKDDYLGLGVKQSIFLKNEREKVYEIFTKYLEFLSENNFYDLNIVSFLWLGFSRPKYDFIVIDEVQDFTNIQLYIVLKSLKVPENFMLCGDSNQIVHPNFFSWTNVKTMFYKHDISGKNINVLRTNYRNSNDVTAIANKLLMIKNARFGSIDKESNFLVESLEENKGSVNFYVDSQNRRKQLNDSTKRSTKYAVLVMTQEEKAAARKVFETPLLFSIHEAKGLEYENIILVNFISNYNKEFNEIANGISKKDLEIEDIDFSRGKDKSDKSLDAYKFYINSLYVGMTRSIKNLHILESSKKHDILSLLDLVENEQQINIKTEVSSLDDWKEEARKLELQGKKEQADDIKKNILHIQKPDWEPITPDNIEELKQKALDPNVYNKKAKDLLFMYALLYNDQNSIETLAKLNYKRAEHPEFERNSINRKYYSNYNTDNVKGVEQEIKRYGVNFRDQFNLTPLLAAAENGSIKVIDFLLNQNAETDVTDNNGRNPFRIAINKLYFSPQSINKLEGIFPRLITDNIRIMVKDRLVKIPNRSMEYFLLNIFMTLQDAIINESRGIWEDKGVKAADLENAIAQYPELIMPDYRKRKTYISSLLSKNEIDGNNPYNNSLFIRIGRGYYCINPDLSVTVADKWINVYEFTGLQKATKLTEEEKDKQVIDRLIADTEEIKKLDPNFSDEHKLVMLDYQRRMEQVYREKWELTQKKKENNSLTETENKNRKKEHLQKKEEKEQIAREKAQQKKEEDEKRQKEIDDMQFRLPF
ncbi:ankyrin repeat domain-containing protein [Draconibacterium sp.]